MENQAVETKQEIKLLTKIEPETPLITKTPERVIQRTKTIDPEKPQEAIICRKAQLAVEKCPTKIKRLTKKEQGFIYYRARGHNITESVLKGGYKSKSRGQANRLGIELLEKAHIVEAVEVEKTHIFDVSMITDEYVLSIAREIRDTTTDKDLLLKVAHFLADCRGMKRTVQKVEHELTVNNKEREEYERLKNELSFTSSHV